MSVDLLDLVVVLVLHEAQLLLEGVVLHNEHVDGGLESVLAHTLTYQATHSPLHSLL